MAQTLVKPNQPVVFSILVGTRDVVVRYVTASKSTVNGDITRLLKSFNRVEVVYVDPPMKRIYTHIYTKDENGNMFCERLQAPILH